MNFSCCPMTVKTHDFSETSTPRTFDYSLTTGFSNRFTRTHSAAILFSLNIANVSMQNYVAAQVVIAVLSQTFYYYLHYRTSLFHFKNVENFQIENQRCLFICSG